MSQHSDDKLSELISRDSIPVSLNIFDETGSVIDTTSGVVTIQQVEDIINHAAQLIEMRRNGTSQEDLDAIMDELEEAMLAASVVNDVPDNPDGTVSSYKGYRA